MKSVLITGANGLIGYELMNQLAGTYEVYAITHSGNINLKGVKAISMDFDREWDEAKLPPKIDVICHFAQSENFREFPNKANEIFNVNTKSTINLLDYATKSGCKKFIYASSGGVYGNSDTGFNEEDPVMTAGELGFYLSTKFCSEILVESYSRFFEVNIARFFFVYGPRQRKTMFIPRIVNSIKEGLEITLQGSEGIKVNPIHVKDAAKAVHSIIGNEGSFNVNIAGKEVLSLKAICDCISNQLGIKPKYIFEAKEPKHLIGDIKKMEKLLLKPTINFSEGIKELL